MNNILRPELIWIEGRCYRINDPTTQISALQEYDLYENEISYEDIDYDDDEDDFEVEMVDNSRFCSTFHVSKHYIGAIIGKKGAMKMRIERDTKTEIKIPRQGQTGDIAVFGSKASNVKAARRRINIIVMSSRTKQRSTHFLSIPVNYENIIKSFVNFKERVLAECPSRGLEESLFIKPTKLHLTLGVMCLMDNEERLQASKLLTEAKEKIIMPMLQVHVPLRLRIKGLSYMNDDPEHIDVLYARVQEESAPSGLLQNLADALVDHYCKAGFMEKEHGRDNVKLHVTLINSKYRSRSSSTAGEEGRNRSKGETFDGSTVLQKFGDFEFGVVEVTEIHLSQRHSMGPDGYYQPTCIVSCGQKRV